MGLLSHDEITTMLFSLGLLLGAARGLGEIAQWLHQPSVVGEILAGVLLGPTVFGAFAPDYHAALFPTAGNVAVALNGLTTLAITLFLLVAGMEVDLSTAWRQGTTSLKIALTGMVVPFVFGFLSRLVHSQSDGSARRCGAFDFRAVFRHGPFYLGPSRDCQDAHGFESLSERLGNGDC